MGVEDVGVEDVQRIENQRAGDPGDVPDRELSVAVIDLGRCFLVETREDKSG